MAKIRAEIVETGNPYIKSARIFIAAPVGEIFAVLANPYRHCEFDGSATLQGDVQGPLLLSLGAKFSMGVKIGMKYRTLNTVEEFVTDHIIAWRHFGGHRWRYQLRAVSASESEVVETFDGSFARFPPALKLINAYKNNQVALLKSLVKLKEIVEGEEGSF